MLIHVIVVVTVSPLYGISFRTTVVGWMRLLLIVPLIWMWIVSKYKCMRVYVIYDLGKCMQQKFYIYYAEFFAQYFRQTHGWCQRKSIANVLSRKFRINFCCFFFIYFKIVSSYGEILYFATQYTWGFYFISFKFIHCSHPKLVIRKLMLYLQHIYTYSSEHVHELIKTWLTHSHWLPVCVCLTLNHILSWLTHSHSPSLIFFIGYALTYTECMSIL